MDIEKSLALVGLTPSEVKIYLSLLKLGSSKAGKVIQYAGLQSSVVYNGINRLIELGLVAHVNAGKQRIFSASDPRIITELMQERERQIARLNNFYSTISLLWRGCTINP